MTRRFKTERAAQQQRLICDSLVELMGEREFAQITVCDICAHANIPRRTFYYYFDGKDEVLEHLIRTIVHECTLESMLPSGVDRGYMQASFARFFRFWRDCRGRELKALMNNGYAGTLISQGAEWVRTESLWADTVGKNQTGLDAMSTQIGTTVVFYVLFYWCEGGFAQSEEEVAAYTTDLLTRPIYGT